MAVSLSSLNARLNDLQEDAIVLGNQHRQLLESQGAGLEAERIEVPAILNDYGVPHQPEQYRHVPRDVQYSRAIDRYRYRLLRAREAIQRLEADGLQLNEQRRRLSRLANEFHDRHAPYVAVEASSRSTFYDISRARDDSEPAPQILSVPERFTSSPQPMIERLSSGAVRASSTSSSSASSSGPEMELPPLRRMGHRNVGDRSPGTSHVMRAYTVEEMVDELHDNRPLHNGLGDRDRSVESDTAEENWNTMLSTIAPDERLPSASSSFASEAASRSFSAGGSSNSNSISNSNPSSRATSAFSSRGTTITVPDGMGSENECDTGELWRSIAERLEREEDVPDEMWVNAGVPASSARIIARSRRERL